MTHTDLIARLRDESDGHFRGMVRDRRTIGVMLYEAADALTAAQERIEVLEGALRDVIEMWDWCSEDPYDRGYGPVSDAVYNASAALDATDNT